MSARSASRAPQFPRSLTVGSAIVLAATVAGCTTEESEPRAADTSAASTTEPGEVVPLARVSSGSDLEPGRYALSVIDDDAAPALPVLSVPEGYSNIEDGVVQADDLERYVWVWAVDSVYAHPCDATAAPVGPSVADLAEALVAQQLRTGTDPVPVTVGGHEGLYVEVAVPEEVDAGACPVGIFNLWPGRHQRVGEILGQVDMVWIVDVDGQRLVFDAAHGPSASPDEVAELEEMVTTATFAPAEGP
jgi:hypothetical protein